MQGGVRGVTHAGLLTPAQQRQAHVDTSTRHAHFCVHVHVHAPCRHARARLLKKAGPRRLSSSRTKRTASPLSTIDAASAPRVMSSMIIEQAVSAGMAFSKQEPRKWRLSFALKMSTEPPKLSDRHGKQRLRKTRACGQSSNHPSINQSIAPINRSHQSINPMNQSINQSEDARL